MSQKIQTRLNAFLVAVVLVLVGFSLGILTANEAGISAEQQLPQSVTEIELQLAGLYEQVSPSVVAITVTRPYDLGAYHTFPPDGSESDPTIQTSGSGFVIDKEGHIVTNYHVVDSAQEVIVGFLDGTYTHADVIGADSSSDVAVIKVDLPADRLLPVTFGRIEEVFVGQSVAAIGSPFNNDWTLTSGIVSAINRTIPSLSEYNIGSAIQTDAAINPGNSGGPLLNFRGEVIGVNAQIASDNRSNSGVGFAIPVDLVQRVAKELIATGEVAYSVIGISGGDVNLYIIETLGLDDNQRGVVVDTVRPGGPAESAGLRNSVRDEAGNIVGADVIIAINGEPIPGIGAILTYLARYTRPDDVVELTVLRNGDRLTMPLTLGRR